MLKHLGLGILATLTACTDAPGASDEAGTGTQASGTSASSDDASEETGSSTDADDTDTTGTTTGDDEGGELCGNGVTEADEQCDDGNDVPNDGCESNCVETTIKELIAGGGSTCIVLEGGLVKCWGNGDNAGHGNYQSLGDDEFVKDVPLVPIGEPVYQLDVAGPTCVILEASRDLKCWGRNLEGQLGWGYQTDSAYGDHPGETPDVLAPIELGGPVAQVAVGGMHVCALLENGDMRCWGSGDRGQLGHQDVDNIGDDEPVLSIPPIDLGVGIKSIHAEGSRSCAVTVEDDLYCWGYNYFGELGYGIDEQIVGDDEPPNAYGPVPIGGKVDKFEMGDSQMCVLRQDGQRICWGAYHSQALAPSPESIGDDEPASQGVPISFSGELVGGLPHLGSSGGCGLLTDGKVECWGWNDVGQLGLGHVNSEGFPSETGGAKIGGPAVAISVGGRHNCALFEDNTVICWGSGGNGRLGQGFSEANIGDNELPEEWGRIDIW